MATISEALQIAFEHHRAGRLELAGEIYRRILEAEPEHAETMNALGVAVLHRGRIREAGEWFRRALQCAPGDAMAHSNLGLVLHAEGRLAEAADHLQQALRLQPANFEARNNLGLVHLAGGELDAAGQCFEAVCQGMPSQALAWANLASVRQAQGLIDEAIGCYRRARELNPGDATIHSSYLNTLQYRADVTLAGLQAAHDEFELRHARPLRATWRSHANGPDPNRGLRLGFVSPHFRKHPVGYFLLALLESLDGGQCEAICYSDTKMPDAVTSRFSTAASAWHEVSGLSDSELVEKIRVDRIDILFDLAGHTSGNRLLVFACKPAPLQVTWLDYVGTTGLSAMDYILADCYEIPPNAEPYYPERVLRMPDGYICYAPPPNAPVVGPLPAIQHGTITFGSLNNPAKISDLVVRLWAKILCRTPGSRLILKYNGLESCGARSRLHRLFAEAGVDTARVELLGGSALAEHLGCYHRIDIALDPLPYNGGLTTCESLWMGVPVVTCPGESFAGRHSLSHLSALGFTETIAGNPDEYVDIAVRLAGDLPRLAEIRARLRSQMAASPLCDGKRFAENLMRLLRREWREWCEKQWSLVNDKAVGE
jgi:predicted O-linked N-acetylglucosamine transferase (SPINDLY family)